MNRNKIFIITGALLFCIFIALLFWLQTMEGQPNELQNSYQIEIFNCSPIAENKTDVKIELNAALHSTGSDKDGIQICHVPTLKINDVSFGIPIYGMNYFRQGMNADMYLYEDRKADETTFFEAADKNEKYLELQKIASKGWFKNESKVILDWSNNRNEFIIYPSQKEKHSKNKKVWKSFLGLRGHIDSLIKIDKSEKNIKVYYFCGSIIDPMLDDDKDGIVNSKDSCPKEKGSIERNGCPVDGDDDLDNVPNSKDKCPTISGQKACDGCICPPPPPCVDKDFDGVCDNNDRCLNEFGFMRYRGCPIPDSDGDGFNDEVDNCKSVKGTLNGCPLRLTHNPSDGTFTVNGLDNINNYNVYLLIKQANNGNSQGGTVKHKFISYSCPNSDESKKILSLLQDPVDLTITVIVEDKNGIELKREIFKKLSMICFSNKNCGFVNLDRIQ